MIKMWLLASACWSILLGGITLIIAIVTFYDEIDGVKHIILSVAVALVLSFILGVFTSSQVNIDSNNWNNGVCPSCGQVWEFKGGSQYRESHTYYYSCDNCYINIEQHILR